MLSYWMKFVFFSNFQEVLEHNVVILIRKSYFPSMVIDQADLMENYVPKEP